MKFNTIILLTILWIFLPVDVISQYIPGQSYFGANDYIEYIAGDLPIILVAPHGGYLEPDELPTIHDRGRDNGSQETTLLLMDSIMTQGNGFRPHVIINHLFPGKMTASDEIDSAAGDHPDARQAWNDFHEFIDDAKSEVVNTWSNGHYFEMHGNGHADMWNEIGLGVSAAYLNGSDSLILSRVDRSTVKNLATEGEADFLEIIRGSTSLGGLLHTRGWNSVPSPANPAPGDGGFFYAGWNTWLHGSRDSGTIDATHLENYYVFMQSANREQYASDLAESILIFMELHYGLHLGINETEFDSPSSYHLQPNFPNPFNPETTLRYGIPVESEITLIIYDIGGNTVKTIKSGSIAAGWYSESWNGLDKSNRPVAAGTYLVELRAGSYSKTIKILYLK